MSRNTLGLEGDQQDVHVRVRRRGPGGPRGWVTAGLVAAAAVGDIHKSWVHFFEFFATGTRHFQMLHVGMKPWAPGRRQPNKYGPVDLGRLRVASTVSEVEK